MNFVEEMRWRGMIQDIMPGTEEYLSKNMTTAYLGIDPTADSLHIGHLVGVMILKHLQRCGHKPIALVGGATGMIGDPSMKSQERNLLDEETLRHNIQGIKAQLSRFLDFDSDAPNAAVMRNNYDWMKDYTFLDFIRDIGKHITVNYMMSKDSVKKRLSGESREGMSFTEFTYQLVQGYDFLYMYSHDGCRLQVGGSDQWGNITTGTELIRRKLGGEAYALTCPLITKADGGKFGKTESGNVWLDPERTSPYKFYQFWLNVTDVDAEKYIKIFTFLGKDEIEALILAQHENPQLRPLQKRLAREITTMVHSEEACRIAEDASQVLFGAGDAQLLRSLDDDTIMSVFEGVPQFEISKKVLKEGVQILELLSVNSQVFPSKGEARRTIDGGGVSVNKQKITLDARVSEADLINGKFIVIQKGKKNYFLLKFA